MNKYIKYCIIFFILFTIILLFVYSYDNNKSEDMNLLMINTGNKFDSDTVSDNNLDKVNNDNRVLKDDNNLGTTNSEKIDSDEYVANDIYETVNEDVYSEENVVSYFSIMESEITNSNSFKEKFKEYFITIIDFIFYNKEIKGYTFSELSNITKVKIISIALKIDSKIEEYIPNYKETISTTSSNVYYDIKEKLVISYMDISTTICKSNEEGCDNVKHIFNEIKDSCKIGWDFLKGLLSSGIYKLKDWYEIYSGK